MKRMFTLALLALLAACHPRGDQEDQCHDVVVHWRTVSTMPMRDADVQMFMGACMMWHRPTIDCMMAATNDDEIKACRPMEK